MIIDLGDGTSYNTHRDEITCSTETFGLIDEPGTPSVEREVSKRLAAKDARIKRLLTRDEEDRPSDR